MSPNNNESIQLPAPVAEQAPQAGGSSGAAPAEAGPKGAEQVLSPESGAQAGSAPPPTLPAIPLPQLPAAPAASQTPAVNQANPTQASDDADLIEKEWVTRAKQIVERTRNDPYKQSEELTVFKADYMKKRYNKTIKVSK